MYLGCESDDNLPDEIAKVPFRPMYGNSTAQVAARAAGTPTTARIKVYVTSTVKHSAIAKQ